MSPPPAKNNPDISPRASGASPAARTTRHGAPHAPSEPRAPGPSEAPGTSGHPPPPPTHPNTHTHTPPHTPAHTHTPAPRALAHHRARAPRTHELCVLASLESLHCVVFGVAALVAVTLLRVGQKIHQLCFAQRPTIAPDGSAGALLFVWWGLFRRVRGGQTLAK